MLAALLNNQFEVISPVVAGDISFDNSVSLEGGGNNNTFAAAMAVANQLNRLMVASISIQDSNHAVMPVITLKWGTQNFTKIRHDEPVDNVRSELWYLLNPDVGTKDLLIGCNGSTWKGVVLHSYYNVAQSGQPNANGGATGDSSAPAASLTVAAANSLIVDAISSEDARIALGSNQTSVGIEQGQSFENVSASRKMDQDAGSKSMSATLNSAQPWAMSVASFSPGVSDGTIELRSGNLPLVSGQLYRLTMKVRSTRTQNIDVDVQDSALANPSLDATRTITANIWETLKFEFTAAATDADSKLRIHLDMDDVQEFWVDDCDLFNLTKERKQYRIMRIQGSMLPGSFIQTLTLREKTAQETA